jgi:hypothetical protein
LYGVRYVLAVDQMLQSIGAAFGEHDLETLLERDADMPPAAISKVVIEWISPENFRNGRSVPAEYRRSEEGLECVCLSSARASGFDRLLRRD